MKKLLRLMAVAVLGLGLTTGIAAAHSSSGTIDTTGPDSSNEIEIEKDSEVEVENDNELSAHIENDQDADTGDATVVNNTTGEDAETGAAMNDLAVGASVEVDNSSSAHAATSSSNGSGEFDAVIENTGPRSDNEVSVEYDSEVSIENDNEIEFTLDNEQDAQSGDAVVSGNTTGGGASTGDASNSAHVEVMFSVTN